jgi:hypothetical protein
MSKQRTILEKYLPPWAPLKPRFARVGDRVLYRYTNGRQYGLGLVEDAALDRKRLFVRPWVETRKVWGEKPRWIRRTDVVAVLDGP